MKNGIYLVKKKGKLERKSKNLTTEEKRTIIYIVDAGWSSLEARRAHNPKVTGSNPVPATQKALPVLAVLFHFYIRIHF